MMDKDNIKDWGDVVKWLTENVWHEIFVHNKEESYQFLDFVYNHSDFMDIDIDKEELDYQISKVNFDCGSTAGFWFEDGCELQILAHPEEEISEETRLEGIEYRYLIQKIDIKIKVNPDEFINLLSIQR